MGYDMGVIAAIAMPAYKRDPHLPSPEVCDWLLSLKWSKPSTVTVIADDGSSEIYDCCITRPALGRDEMIDLALPADGIKMLQKDAEDRREAAEGCDNDNELEAFCDTIEDLIKNGNLKVGETVGALYMIAANLAAVANLAAKSQD
jgi:hypothetical protein